MYNLVILDGLALNPGDLDWDGLKKLAKCTIYDRTLKEQLNSRVKDADIIITNKVVIDREVLENAKNLKYIVVSATGYNIVDIEACKEYGVAVSNVPSYSTESVVQQVFGYILLEATKICQYNESVKNGEWENSSDFTYQKYRTFEIFNKNIGIIGYGNIGKRVAEVANSFGMNVYVFSRTKPNNLPEYIKFTDLDGILKYCDIITIHLPLTDKTKDLIRLKEINRAKENVIFINTARGGIINEKDLSIALNENRVSFAGIDVLSNEPPQKNCEIINAKNSVITPHRAWATIEARKRLLNTIEENIKSFIIGDIINRVDI